MTSLPFVEWSRSESFYIRKDSNSIKAYSPDFEILGEFKSEELKDFWIEDESIFVLASEGLLVLNQRCEVLDKLENGTFPAPFFNHENHCTTIHIEDDNSLLFWNQSNKEWSEKALSLAHPFAIFNIESIEEDVLLYSILDKGEYQLIRQNIQEGQKWKKISSVESPPKVLSTGNGLTLLESQASYLIYHHKNDHVDSIDKDDVFQKNSKEFFVVFNQNEIIHSNINTISERYIPSLVTSRLLTFRKDAYLLDENNNLVSCDPKNPESIQLEVSDRHTSIGLDGEVIFLETSDSAITTLH